MNDETPTWRELHETTNPEFLATHALHSEMLIRLTVAGNPHTATATLATIAEQEFDPYVVAALAGNPNTDGETLHALTITAHDTYLHALVAEHPNLLPHTAEFLTRQHPSVRLNLAGNPVTPAAVLYLLSEDENTPVRTDAVTNLFHRGAFADYPEEWVETLYDIRLNSIPTPLPF